MRRIWTWKKLGIVSAIIGASFAVVQATDLIITDPAYVGGTATIGSQPLSGGNVTLRTAGSTLQGNVSADGSYGPILVQSTAEDEVTLLEYSSELRAIFQAQDDVLPGADILSNTDLRVRRLDAALQAASDDPANPEVHDFSYSDTDVKLVALTVRMAASSPGTLDRINAFTNEFIEGAERISARVNSSLGGGTERTLVMPVVGTGVVTFRGTIYLRTPENVQVQRSLPNLTVDLGAAGPYTAAWPDIDISDVGNTGSLDVSMALNHPDVPTPTQQQLRLTGVGSTPTQGINPFFNAPTPGTPFTVTDVISGDYFISYARSYFSGGYLQHPYPNQDNRVTIPISGTADFDADVDLVHVSGAISLSGMLGPSSISGRSIEAQADNNASSPTRGGYASMPVDPATGGFDLWLPPGNWQLFRHRVSAFESETADQARLSASITSNQSLYLPPPPLTGPFIDLQSDTDLADPDQGIDPIAMSSLFFDVEAPFFRPDPLLRCPSLNGYSSQQAKSISINASGDCTPRPVHELRFIAEPGNYTINAQIRNADNDSLIQFNGVSLFINEPAFIDGSTPSMVLQPDDPGPPVRNRVEVFPQGVTNPGYMTVTQSPIGPKDPERRFRIFGPNASPTYYNITVSSEFAFSTVRVCISFPDVDPILETRFVLRHFTNGTWVSLTNQTVDAAANVICGDTDSFSPFVITVPLPATNAGPDQTVCVAGDGELAAVTLDGSGTTNPLGLPLTYSWSQDGTEIATGASPTVSLGVGTHALSLRVNDGVADAGLDEVQVTVEVCESTCYADNPFWEACTPECPCPHGIGDCDEDVDCADGLRCLHDVGPDFGYDDPETDVCAAGCPDAGVGGWNFCTPECPCDDGEGDCDEDADCADGLRCLHDAGPAYGYDDPELDVCAAGCPSAGVGAWNFCTPECPCSAGQGDCDDDVDCAPGLRCVSDVGPNYGFDGEVDVCE
ncbi:hypothetical protein [Haliangium sp.]|uniref:hypothetical protein n=1 Tax=Haliangium sp. TaxID=2663208 RepID=UPI003D09FC6D